MKMSNSNSRFSNFIETRDAFSAPRKSKQEYKQEHKPEHKTNTNRFKQQDSFNDNTSFMKTQATSQTTKIFINQNDFPALSAVSGNNTNEKMSFKTLFNKNNTKNDNKCRDSQVEPEIDPDLKNLEPGWLLIKRDKTSSKPIMKGNIIDNVHTNISNKTMQTPAKKEHEEISELFQSIIETNRRRKDEFIELNGYDVWESMYQFPDYNYNYFDMLDELEAELEEGDEFDDYDEQDKYSYDDYDDSDYYD
jgi:hypothetical protein